MKINYDYIKRCRFLFLFLGIYFFLFIFYPDIGYPAFEMSIDTFMRMLRYLPAIFILMGLLDTWIDKKHMQQFLGEKSGAKGHLIAFFLGSFAAGPVYIAFPIAFMLLKKGSSFTNIFLFLGAWSTLKVAMLSYEMASLGFKYTLIRLITNLIGICIIGYLMNKILNQEDKEKILSKEL